MADKEKTRLELLEEVKKALDFQLSFSTFTDSNSISLKNDHAYICLIAVEKLISRVKGEDNGTK